MVYLLHSFIRFSLIIVASMLLSTTAFAATTTPDTYTYNGHLLDGAGDPITSPIDIRFSIWNSADYVTADTLAGGGINTGAATYANWQEVHSVTTNADGYFSVTLGDSTPLPSFAFSAIATSNLTSLFLQVDAKLNGTPDTSYELLDCDVTATARDRSPIFSVPFAHNADYLDQRELGTGSGNIPLLASGGLLNIVNAPWGTNSDSFTVDADGSVLSGSTINVAFGNAGAMIAYNVGSNQFEFNEDVYIDGDLTVTGLINGVDITALAASTTITGSKLDAFSPHYENASYSKDGADNIGRMVVQPDAAEGNFYHWTSTRLTLQDYDINLEHTVPLNFMAWDGTTPFEVRYRTSGAAANSALDVALYDTTGVLVASSLGLTSPGSWSSVYLTPAGTWTPGENFYVILKPQTLNGHSVDIGQTRFIYDVVNSN